MIDFERSSFCRFSDEFLAVGSLTAQLQVDALGFLFISVLRLWNLRGNRKLCVHSNATETETYFKYPVTNILGRDANDIKINLFWQKRVVLDAI